MISTTAIQAKKTFLTVLLITGFILSSSASSTASVIDTVSSKAESPTIVFGHAPEYLDLSVSKSYTVDFPSQWNTESPFVFYMNEDSLLLNSLRPIVITLEASGEVELRLKEIGGKTSKMNFNVIKKAPLVKNDAVVLGLLLLCLAFVFYTSTSKNKTLTKFYKVVPALLMCYLLPSVLASLGIVNSVESSSIYYIATRYLLPSALVLMTLSIDLKGIINLGPKSLIMFFTGTIGIIIGGPIAILLVSTFSPETVG
ncbi:MAG: hypothetical protein ACI9UJ_001525, partial [bacterium]